MPDDQQLPTPGNRQHARRAADEKPTEYDGPTEERQPDMPEPEPEKPFFPESDPAPVGASPLMAYVLSVVHDRALRRKIEEAIWSINAGLDGEDHLLTKAAALFTAVLENNAQREVQIVRALEKLIAGIAEEALTMAQPGGPGAPGLDMDALREVFRDEAEEGLKTAYRLGFRTALMFAGGGVVVGLVLAFIIHIL